MKKVTLRNVDLKSLHLTFPSSWKGHTHLYASPTLSSSKLEYLLDVDNLDDVFRDLHCQRWRFTHPKRVFQKSNQHRRNHYTTHWRPQRILISLLNLCSSHNARCATPITIVGENQSSSRKSMLTHTSMFNGIKRNVWESFKRMSNSEPRWK